MNDRVIRGLYALTPDEPDTPRLVAMVQAALDGGARLVQYRNKVAPLDLRRAQAAALLRICKQSNVPLIVNDLPDVASEIGADGVHLGRDDGDVGAARAQLPGKLLGVSCYDDIARAIAAERAGADYVAFGRFFASITKPGDIRASLELVRQAKRRVRVPIVAIGGITLEHTPALIAGGIDAVAVISALFSSADVRDTARRFAALFNAVPQ
jgi:thiamine-phosphate pyrophosphorylase